MRLPAWLWSLRRDLDFTVLAANYPEFVISPDQAEENCKPFKYESIFLLYWEQEVAARDEGEKLIVKFDDLTLPAQKSGNATA